MRQPNVPGKVASRTRRTLPASLARKKYRPAIDGLEDRRLLSTIQWTDRGSAVSDTDHFNATYGANANAARAIVDATIQAWSNVIANFNYAGGGNTYRLNVTAGDLGGGGRGVTSNITHDASGKPTSASI